MTDEFILEEDEGQVSSNRRPFLLAAGGLIIIGVLAVACIAVILFTRAPDGQEEEIHAIETQNAIVAVTNAAVTKTIAALETEAAMPTNTPEATATSTETPIPTQTPRPTDTPVVQQAEEEEVADGALSGTSVFGAGAQGDTPTPIAPLGSTGEGALPQTGISTWGASVAALILIAVLIAARRLRSS